MLDLCENWRNGRTGAGHAGGERFESVPGRKLALAVNLHNFTACTAFHRKIMYTICGEKPTFHRLSYIFSRFLLHPGR